MLSEQDRQALRLAKFVLNSITDEVFATSLNNGQTSPRPDATPRVPKYCLHKSTGQAVVYLPLGQKKYQSVYLGRHGTEASKRKYDHVLARWLGTNRRPTPAGPEKVTVKELAEYLTGQSSARPGGQPTLEIQTEEFEPMPPLFVKQIADMLRREGRPGATDAAVQVELSRFAADCPKCRTSVPRQGRTGPRWAYFPHLVIKDLRKHFPREK